MMNMSNNKKRRSFIGQVTIETTLALVVLFVLLMGTARIFKWLTTAMVERQLAFQLTRVGADGKGFSRRFLFRPLALRVLPEENLRLDAWDVPYTFRHPLSAGGDDDDTSDSSGK